MRKGSRRADLRRVHALEYELGLRDDAPPGHSDTPTFDAVLKELYGSNPTAGQRAEQIDALMGSAA